MKLTPPKKVTYYIALVFFIIGILAKLVGTVGLASYAIWIVAFAFLLLAIANAAKGL